MEFVIIMIYVSFALFIVLALSLKWVLFGIKLLINRMRYGDNLGLIFFRSLGGTFSLPKFIDLRKTADDTKETFRPLTRDSFKGPRFFGVPAIFVDAEDASVTTGFYKKLWNVVTRVPKPNEQKVMLRNVTADKVYEFFQVEAKVSYDEAKREFEVIGATHVLNLGSGADGQPRYYDTGIPKLVEEKPSVRVSAATIKQAVIQSGFSKVIDMFNKNTMLIIGLSGLALLAAVVGGFFAFTNQTAINTVSANIDAMKPLLETVAKTVVANVTGNVTG